MAASSPEEYNASKAQVVRTLKAFQWKLALLMLGIFAVLCITYYVLLRMYVMWASPVLYTLAAVLFLAFFCINGGFSRTVVLRENLPAHWTEEHKNRFLENDRIRKSFARRLMVVMVPVLLLCAIDMLSMFVLPLFKL